MGVDVTYPLWRSYGWTRTSSAALGGPQQTLAAVPVAETDGKNLELTEEQRAFKQEIRDYFDRLVEPGGPRTLLTERHGDTYHRIIKQMGADGWMGVGWPTEYGGRGLGEVEQQVFANEAARCRRAPAGGDPADRRPDAAGVRHGEAEGHVPRRHPVRRRALRDRLQRARRGHRPGVVAHLRAAVERRRRPDYVVNGQKMWTTGGHAADFVWLAVRTDPDAPKHKGISVLIVDTRDPGYSWTPIITADGSHHVNATYFHDVRVPVDMLVGEENEGWQLITTQLNHERVMLGPAGRFEGLRDLVARVGGGARRRSTSPTWALLAR